MREYTRHVVYRNRALCNFGGQSDPPPVVLPPIPPPAVMPVPDDAAGKKARRRSLLSQRQRTGRAETILSDAVSGDTLG